MRTCVVVSLSLLVVGAPAGAGASPRGGSIRAFVALACDARVAAVDVDSRRVLWQLRVPRGPQELAATVDGRRVLVLSPTGGTVTQLDGNMRRVSAVYGGFEKPVQARLSFTRRFGYVGSRYAYVTDESAGVLAVLDLARRQVVARLPVGRSPTRFADDLGGHLWIAHASGIRNLTVVDVSTPARPRVVGTVAAREPVRDLAFATDGLSLFLAYGRAGVARIRVSDRRVLFRRPGLRAGRIVVADDGRTVWVTNRRTGGLLVLAPRDGHALRAVGLHGYASAVAAAGSWVGAANSDRLTLETAPRGFRIDIPLGAGCASGLAFAVV